MATHEWLITQRLFRFGRDPSILSGAQLSGHWGEVRPESCPPGFYYWNQRLRQPTDREGEPSLLAS